MKKIVLMLLVACTMQLVSTPAPPVTCLRKNSPLNVEKLLNETKLLLYLNKLVHAIENQHLMVHEIAQKNDLLEILAQLSLDHLNQVLGRDKSKRSATD
jgi:hypothetical protein